MIRMNTPEQVGRLLSEITSEAIKHAGLSQRATSESTGIPLVTLSRRLTGRSAFTVPEIAAIARASGVSVVELFLRVERAQSASTPPAT
ncbi:MAG TPA: helix-turn-helix transcriptional regulator [Coriobacteriia bacterium]|nr:helix-turn-helix transcriptional regulator [Coriobacteriia bacterium]